jgi:hypothetical protein
MQSQQLEMSSQSASVLHSPTTPLDPGLTPPLPPVVVEPPLPPVVVEPPLPPVVVEPPLPPVVVEPPVPSDDDSPPHPSATIAKPPTIPQAKPRFMISRMSKRHAG